MTSPQFLDEAIEVEGKLADSEIQPQAVTWRNRTYTVVSLGRRWQDEGATHYLLELHDHSRMEIQQDRDHTWRLRRYWPAATAA